MYPGELVTLGTLIGVVAGIGILGTTLSAHAGASASVINTVASLALAVPIILALVFYHQIPKIAQGVGLLLTVAAILLLQGVSASDTHGSPLAARTSASRHLVRATYMALMFLGNGLAQFLQARLHHEGLGAFQSSALTLMYLAGAVCSLIALLLFHGRVNSGAFRYGCLVGLASYCGNACVASCMPWQLRPRM